MKPAEKKFVCDLLSLVGNAVATGTIPEAVEYLTDHYNCVDDPVLEHTYDVLNNIYNKQITI